MEYWIRPLTVALAACTSSLAAAEATARSTAEEIRAETMRADDGAGGRPLPLASHWTTGSHQLSAGWAPARQMELIEEGHHILPWFAHPPISDDGSPAALEAFAAYYEAPIRRACELKLPFVLVSTQWEHLLSGHPYLGLPLERNPNVVGADGTARPAVSPFGPVGPWRDVGRSWTSGPGMRQLEEWYPDPPLVIFLSNNEHSKLEWHRAEDDARYVALHGRGKDDAFKRGVVAAGWIERYRALQDGMRDGLASRRWKDAARFVGYDAFGIPHFGRWAGWAEYSLATPECISPDPRMWDGGSPSYYTHNWNASTDFTGWSPQVEFQNLVFMAAEAHRLNPAFWVEISVWDGFTGGTVQPLEANDKRKLYESFGQIFTPERYAGFVQFGMWLLRPRAVREFRSWIHPWEDGGPYFLQIVEAVDRVHRNPVLREWWRKGTLVPNRTRKHFYQSDIPEGYREVDRWFLLDADVNPPPPWELSTRVRVFSLALVQGEAPARRWLVYAHSPLGSIDGAKIAIPGYRNILIDVAVAGTFHEIDEGHDRSTMIR